MSTEHDILEAFYFDKPFCLPTEPSEIFAEINAPKWSEKGRVHDWRNHVNGTFQAMWDRLSVETRLVIYLSAEEAASEEEWD